VTRIMERRKAQGMTREELAAKAGVSYGGVVKWETGERLPRVDFAIKIAKALKTTAEKLW